MKKTKFKENTGFNSQYTAYKTFDGKPLTKEELNKINKGEDIDREYKEVGEYKNLVVLDGRNLMQQALAGDLSAIGDIEASHQELGTDATSPSDSDSGLGTPDATTRKTISSFSVDGSVTDRINVTMFWSDSQLTNGTTYKEAGLFINGSGTSNSGTLFNRFNIDIAISAGEALTIDGEINLN